MAVNMLLSVVYPLVFAANAPLGKAAKAWAYVMGVLLPFVAISIYHFNGTELVLLSGCVLSFTQLLYFAANKPIRYAAIAALVILALANLAVCLPMAVMLLLAVVPLTFRRLDGLRYAL